MSEPFNPAEPPKYALSRPIRLALWPLMAIAGIGFAIMAAVHVSAMAGYDLLPPDWFGVLFAGLVIVSLSTIFVSNQLTKDVPAQQFWKAALRGCPRWTLKVFYILVGYVWLGFFFFNLLMGNDFAGRAMILAVVMLFYGIAFALHYSAIHATDARPLCPSGHPVGWNSKFCDECGQHVTN